MRKQILAAAVAALSAAALTSCGSMTGVSGTSTTSSTTQQSSIAGDALGNLLGGLIGNAVTVNESNLAGTWVYQAPEVRFESENLLAKAGGSVAAASIEEKLAEVYAGAGILPGKCSFTFDEDKNCTIVLNSKTINGTYTLDSSTHEINITAALGLLKLNGKVYFGLGDLALVFDAKKLLTIAQTLSTVTGQQNSSAAAIATALDQYQGLMLGMSLKK